MKIQFNFAYLVEEPSADGHIERVVVEDYFVKVVSFSVFHEFRAPFIHETQVTKENEESWYGG
jgi:hypothetical protein